MPTKAQEISGRMEKVATDITNLFKEYGGDISTIPAEKGKDAKAWHTELNDLGKQLDDLTAMDDIRLSAEKQLKLLGDPNYKYNVDVSGASGGSARQTKSIGELFSTHADYLGERKKIKPNFAVDLPDVGLKTLMTTTTGYAPETHRSGILIYSDQRRPVVADLIPTSNTDQTAIRFMVETTFTNNADTVAEGAQKPESELGYNESTFPVEVIANMLPVTNQQLEDVDGIRELINSRLTLMVELAEEDQLLNGSGTSPDLHGFYGTSGLQNQAQGTDNIPDAAYKLMTKIRFTAYSNPTGFIFHPNDWQKVKLLRTSQDIYIWGSPADPDGIDRLWGIPVVVTNAATEGIPLCGDWRMYSHISRKKGLRLDVSDSHSDYFGKNKIAIRLEERLCLEVYKGNAFGKLTLV